MKFAFAFALLMAGTVAGQLRTGLFDLSGCSPTAINNNNVIVGICEGSQGFIRDAQGHVTKLPQLYPTALNNRGTVAGYLTTPDAPGSPVGSGRRGFVRSPGGSVSVFSIENGTFVHPLAINSSGQVVGYYAGFYNHEAFYRAASGKITILTAPCCDTPLAYKAGVATGINDDGEVAVTGVLPVTDGPQAVTWKPGKAPILVGPINNLFFVSVFGINNAGATFGTFAQPAAGGFQTSAWVQPAGAAPTLFDLQSANFLLHGAINKNRAAIVSNDFNISFYIGSDLKIRPITVDGCNNPNALAITDSGIVVGSCTGTPSGFVWIP